MLVDAAKDGDVEIPVFCYEPKLGDPVGACRMCLVEIEGIPKLQTACSTPVRDGMVVYTQTDRVKEAQNAVVEFLLVNHPLDCPVCDKGGECPLQDISMGWGHGTSRVTDPKRHFQKPIPLSPLIKIDRERCILCYRCVRFSQEVAEDEQLQLLERGPKTFVGTFNDRPYVAPFHGNIIELCPVGALTSQSLPLPRPALGHRGRGLGLHAVPEPVQRQVHGPRRGGRPRPRPRQRGGRRRLALRQGPLRLPDVRLRPTGPPRRRSARAARCAPASWEEALDRAARGLTEAHGKVAAIVGGGASNEEAYLLQRMVRGPLGSGDVAGAPACGARRPTRAARSATRPWRSRPPSIDHADAILVARHRPDARDADPRAADPQGRPPPRRRAAGRDRAADRARRRRRGRQRRLPGGRRATRPAARADFLEGLAADLASGDARRTASPTALNGAPTTR